VASGTPLNLSAAVSGGYPPYRWTVLEDGATVGTGALATPGNLNLTILAANGSSLVFAVQIADQLGEPSNASEVVPLLAAPTGGGGPGPAPASALGGATTPVAIGLAVLTLAALLVPRWRRRHAEVGTDPAEAARTVERLLEEADGLDRETLAYRGENEGLRRTEVFDALAALRRQGRIGTREGLEGEELLFLESASGPGREGSA
jgi:hypothetical protein